MGSFSGYKLVGVNPHSANVGVAMMLADFITNEDNQNKRFNDRKLGPPLTSTQTPPRLCSPHPPLPHWLSRAPTLPCSG